MQKRIIAIIGVVILLASMLVACSKKNKLYTQEINGIMRPVVTDENGELVTDFSGNIKIYVTNESGEAVTNENGEINYNYVKPPMAYVSNNKVKIEHFEVNIPEGFTANALGWIFKDDSNGNCYIKVLKEATVSKELSFPDYLQKIINDNKLLVEAINTGKYAADGYKEAGMAWDDLDFLGFDAHIGRYKILSPEDKVVHYAENIYILVDEDIYSINYACEDGVGYDESFNFAEWAEQNIKFYK